jgi:hypothetical protein
MDTKLEATTPHVRRARPPKAYLRRLVGRLRRAPAGCRQAGRLSAAEELALRSGTGVADCWGDPAAASAAWWAHREAVMAAAGCGRRPWAWWVIERRMPVPALDVECILLARMGELTADELHEIRVRARLGYSDDWDSITGLVHVSSRQQGGPPQSAARVHGGGANSW